MRKAKSARNEKKERENSHTINKNIHFATAAIAHKTRSPVCVALLVGSCCSDRKMSWLRFTHAHSLRTHTHMTYTRTMHTYPVFTVWSGPIYAIIAPIPPSFANLLSHFGCSCRGTRTERKIARCEEGVRGDACVGCVCLNECAHVPSRTFVEGML